MTETEKEVVGRVLNHYLNNEDRPWNDVDEFMILLDSLSDDELFRESDAIYSEHKYSKIKCLSNHPITECWAPMAFEAMEIILEQYRDIVSPIFDEHRYILQNYLAYYQVGAIVVE